MALVEATQRFFRKSDYEERNIASFSTDSYGLTVSFGYPISEVSRIGLYRWSRTNGDQGRRYPSAGNIRIPG